MRIILLSLLFIFGLFYVAKADYRVSVLEIEHKETKETKTLLYIQGGFTKGISKDTQILVDKYGSLIEEVVFYSQGGLSYEGYTISHIMSDNRFKVRVPNGGYCLSACAIAYIGGTDYKLNGGLLGFHKGHLGNGQVSFKDQEEAFDNGQQSGSYATVHMMANGFSYWLSREINDQTSPTTFKLFNKVEDLMHYYVRNDDNYKEDDLNRYLKEVTPKGFVWKENEILNYLKENPGNSNWKVKKIIQSIENIKEKSDVK